MPDTLYWAVADTCTRCEQPFASGAIRYMVRETVVYQMLADGSFAIFNTTIVAVCAGCLQPRECGPWRDRTCEGCTAPLRQYGYEWQNDLPSSNKSIVACCPRCRLRAARRRRRLSRPLVPCVHCLRFFQPKRSDARYCHQRCKQAAYRERKINKYPNSPTDFMCGGVNSSPELARAREP